MNCTIFTRIANAKMTAVKLKRSELIVLIFIVLCTCEFKLGENTDNLEDRFCTKSEEGSRCLSEVDVTLTRLENFAVGEVKELDVQGRKLELKTLSIKPLIFEIQNFLSNEECDHFIATAKSEGLFSSHTEKVEDKRNTGQFQLIDSNLDKQLSLDEMKLTIENAYDIYLDEEDLLQMYEDLNLDSNQDKFITPDELADVKPVHIGRYLRSFIEKHPEKHSRYSKQVWLFPDSSKDEIFENVQKRVATLVQLPLNLIRLSDFQIVDYDVKGHYNAHWDSAEVRPNVPCCDRGRTKQCRICRYMTILFYLNDVEGGGETAFPVANNDTLDMNKVHTERKAHLYKKCSDANLRVPPEKGKAIIWYNHFINNETGWMGDLDLYTLHGGCPVTKGEKWIANFWIKTTDSKTKDMTRMKKFYSSDGQGK